ncbi:hypothetical protein ACLOJK_041651 [Asimina triloba]
MPHLQGNKRSASSEGKKRISADLENGKSKMAFREHGSLRLRFELQKFLREQLEFQRTFQLQAKQSVDQLQMLLEEQKKVSQAFFQAHKPVSSVSSSSGKEASSDPPAADEVQILTDSLTTFSGWNQKMLDLAADGKWVISIVSYIIDKEAVNCGA